MSKRTVYDLNMSIKNIDYGKRSLQAQLTYKDAPLATTMHKVTAAADNLTDAQVKQLKYMQGGKIPTVAGGAALGALIGSRISEDGAGAVIGAGIGGIAGAAVHSGLNSKYNLEIAESILKKAVKAL